MHFVLNCFEEFNADIQRWIIVDAGGVDIFDFLIKTALRGSEYPECTVPALQNNQTASLGFSGVHHPAETLF